VRGKVVTYLEFELCNDSILVHCEVVYIPHCSLLSYFIIYIILKLAFSAKDFCSSRFVSEREKKKKMVTLSSLCNIQRSEP